MKKIICALFSCIFALTSLLNLSKNKNNDYENIESPIAEFDSSEDLASGFSENEKQIYKELCVVKNNKIIFDEEKSQDSKYDSDKVEIIRTNAHIINSLVDSVPYSSINPEGKVVFDIPKTDESKEDEADFKALWAANYISANLWSVKFHLDSDFAMVFGIAGLIYRVVNYAGGITGALKLTKDKLTDVLYTAIFHIPMNIGCAAAINFIKSSACQVLLNVVITGWNAVMIAAKTNPFSALVYEIVMFALGLCLPSLVTSVQMIYQSGKYRKGVNCEFIYWFFAFNWWTA